MTTPKTKATKVDTLEAEIAKAAEKLKKLQEKQKEKIKVERERNQKTVMELIKTERLDSVTAEKWKEMMPQIKALLVVE